jgi:hypothetical protein
MTTQSRLKGQEVSIRVVQDATTVDTLDSISSMNDEVALEIKEDGFLGEPVNRFDEILNGYGGDFEMQLTNANWTRWQQAIIDRATRRKPSLKFNIVRTDFYASGDSSIFTYKDVKWGSMPTTIGARGDFVKVKASFKCSERSVQTNALP